MAHQAAFAGPSLSKVMRALWRHASLLCLPTLVLATTDSSDPLICSESDARMGSYAIPSSNDVARLSRSSRHSALLQLQHLRSEQRVSEEDDETSLRAAMSSGGALLSGSKIYLRSHTGSVISVGDGSDAANVHAHWQNRGEWETLTIDKESTSASSTISSGDKVYFTAYNGNVISCGYGNDPTIIHARWSNKLSWETFIILKDGGGTIYDGDSVVLRSHTLVPITAGNGQDSGKLHATWNHTGTWQHFRIEVKQAATTTTTTTIADGSVAASSTLISGCPMLSQLPACSTPSSGQWVVQSSCKLGSGRHTLNTIVVRDGAHLVVEQGADLQITTPGGILIKKESALWMGCEGTPFTGHVLVTFTGSLAKLGVSDYTFVIKYQDYGLPVRTESLTNGLVVEHGGRLEIHGSSKTSWTRLAGDAESGSTVLQLEQHPVGWTKGDQLLVASTTSRKEESEYVTIAAVREKQVVLASGLLHDHVGHWTGRGSRLNAEVASLTRNILFTSTVDAAKCSPLLEAADATAKEKCFGGQLIFLQHSVVRVENAEFEKLGEGLIMGRYPLHFHLAGDHSNSYLRQNSVHNNFNRCITLHSAFNTLVEGNVCIENHGHNLYLEDGIEFGNRLLDNLVVNPLTSATICSDFQDLDWAGKRPSVSGMWITNPNNTFTGNVVVGAQFGVWFTFPTATAWKTPYSNEAGIFGGVFGASVKYFADGASGYGSGHWVMQQEQGRTPTIFHNNTVKGSQRNGIFIDGLITNSEDPTIPCLSGAGQSAHSGCPTCPLRVHSFNWAPTIFDVSVKPSLRTYVVTENFFEDIVVAYGAAGEDHHGRPSSSYWASGGAVTFKRAIFAYNGLGASLHNPVDFCASHVYWGVSGITARWTDSLFLGTGSERAFKFYDGGYLVQNSRWAGLEYLADTRSESNGNVNGLILKKSAPLGWFDSDASDTLFQWAMTSGHVTLQSRSSTLPNLADWSSDWLVGQWENANLFLATMDGFGDAIPWSSYHQFVYNTASPSRNSGWGPGVVEEATPTCRMFYQCGYTNWCGTGVDCTPGFACKDLLSSS